MTTYGVVKKESTGIIAWAYTLPFLIPSIPWRVVVAVLLWPIVTGMLLAALGMYLLAIVCWFLLIGWWMPAVIRPRIRW